MNVCLGAVRTRYTCFCREVCCKQFSSSFAFKPTEVAKGSIRIAENLCLPGSVDVKEHLRCFFRDIKFAN